MEYIERTKVMNICRKYSEHCFETNDSRGQDIADRIEEDIVALPTADVEEVKHGEWINVPPYRALSGEYLKGQECSVCHRFFISEGRIHRIQIILIVANAVRKWTEVREDDGKG